MPSSDCCGTVIARRVTLYSLLIVPLPLLFLVLPAPGSVRLFVAPPPGRDDTALQRSMGVRDETVSRGEMCEQTFHRMCALRQRVPSPDCSYLSAVHQHESQDRLLYYTCQVHFGVLAFAPVRS